MCLFTKKEWTTADKPLKCWKFIEIVEGFEGERIPITPYAFTRVPEQVIQGNEPFKANKPKDLEIEYTRCDGEACLSNGYIHTFCEMNMGILNGEMEYLSYSVGKNDDYICVSADTIGCQREPKVLAIQLWRCEIPAGTGYVRGEVECTTRGGYASDEIMFKEMVLEISNENLAGNEFEDDREKEYEKLIQKINSETNY